MIDLQSYGASVRAVARRAVTVPQDRRLLAALVLGYPAWQGVVRGARALDRVIAPGVTSQPVREPVFLVGHPRSGTTFLHRLLALDPRFSALRAWQLVVPAVSLYRGVTTLRRVGAARAVASRLDRQLFGAMAARHQTTWNAPEEDDWLFLHAAASPTLAYLTGRPDICRRYWIGDALPPAVRHRAMRWYLRSVQRHLFATRPDATLLSKNPHFTGWIRTLEQTFPEARFVMLVRDPAHAIASRLDLLAKAWRAPTPREDGRLRTELEGSLALYRHAETVWPEVPEARRLRVRFDRLVSDPVAELDSIYTHFGWEADGAVRDRWNDRAAEARRRVPHADPPLRHFGIGRDEIARALEDLEDLWEGLGRAPEAGARRCR